MNKYDGCLLLLFIIIIIIIIILGGITAKRLLISKVIRIKKTCLTGLSSVR